MASPSGRAVTQAPKNGRPSFSTAPSLPSPNASMLLEKTKAGTAIRRSTPDSEVFVQSDDEQDHRARTQTSQPPNPAATKVNRRSSWLNDIPPAAQRKGSIAASSSLSGANSYPNTPSGDQGPFSSGSITSPTIGSNGAWGQTFWGTGIWNNDPRKPAPARVSEILPSPSSTNGMASGDYFELKNNPAFGNVTESAIPFPIPLHPTPKTYRSQSYSVGQLDPDSLNSLPSNAGVPLYANRNRNGLQHRPSRPSMLGNVDENAPLGRLHEVEDDDSTTGSEDDRHWSISQAQRVKQLALENALLKQAFSQAEQGGLPHRASVSSAVSGGFSRQSAGFLNQAHMQSGNGLDLAVEDIDELSDYHGHGSQMPTGRRYSEYSANADNQYSPMFPENRKLESIKKGFWQSSPGIGGFAEPPQSRRHSFADMPTRRGSMNSVAGEPTTRRTGMTQVSGSTANEDMLGRLDDGTARPIREDNSEYAFYHIFQAIEEKSMRHRHLQARCYAASYFAGLDPSSRGGEVQSPTTPISSLQAYGVPNPYGRPQHFPSSHHYHQSLVIVTFKCYRADAFYVQEDTGLQVKQGDLVIVEADRGTDLGTVACEGVIWTKAKELKEQYAEEHYKWLMMFSRHNQSGNPNAVNPNGLPNHGGQGSAVGGMGPPGHHNLQEPGSGELKPKMIKRLAQNHEIQALRDKEGNEAKAKRVCQQKVIEHRLNMEILDAEFQMDWKKLTFYYFADTYINFNSLVTDLFKIYKTRIWMSAINPASFASPSAGLQLPTGLGAGNLGHGRGSPGDRRRHHEQSYGNRSPGSFPQPDVGRDADSLQVGGFVNPYVQSYQQPPIGVRPTGLGVTGFAQPGQAPLDNFNGFASGTPSGQDPQLGEYPGGANSNLRGLPGIHPIGSEWLNNFQGLSLGS
ncbi:MAG: hypothetical protein M1834_003170 [Cirrosporium novae-zelandiae]|nr:MAG: hypothetical protein M1834_003170 [Cirrosporium novae-zelandiae]